MNRASILILQIIFIYQGATDTIDLENNTTMTLPNKKGDCEKNINVILHAEKGSRGEIGPPGPQGPSGPRGLNGGGLTYTRWGRTSCPSTAQSVYQGTTVGSAFYESGSSDYLCLHSQPQYIRTTGGQQTWRGKLYATEYDTFDAVPTFAPMFRHDVPCIVCYAETRSAKIMIPGRIACPSSWTREYYGYLMGIDHHQPRGSRSPICVDVNAESVPGSIVAHVKSVLNFYETTCLGIDCPPYFDGAETTCVVCTK